MRDAAMDEVNRLDYIAARLDFLAESVCALMIQCGMKEDDASALGFADIMGDTARMIRNAGAVIGNSFREEGTHERIFNRHHGR